MSWAPNDKEMESMGRDTHPPSAYHRKIHGVWVDVYDVLRAWGVADPAVQHAIKKLLRAGTGHKTRKQDFTEALESLRRALEIER